MGVLLPDGWRWSVLSLWPCPRCQQETISLDLLVVAWVRLEQFTGLQAADGAGALRGGVRFL